MGKKKGGKKTNNAKTEVKTVEATVVETKTTAAEKTVEAIEAEQDTLEAIEKFTLKPTASGMERVVQEDAEAQAAAKEAAMERKRRREEERRADDERERARQEEAERARAKMEASIALSVADSTLSIDGLDGSSADVAPAQTDFSDTPEMAALNEMLASEQAKLIQEKAMAEAKKLAEQDRVKAEADATAKWQHDKEEEKLQQLAQAKTAEAARQWDALTEAEATKHIKAMVESHKGKAETVTFEFTSQGDGRSIGLELGCLTEQHRKEIDPSATQFAYVHRVSGEAQRLGVRPYDIITAINGDGATGIGAASVETVETALRNAARPCTITFQRGCPPQRQESCVAECMLM